MREGEGRMVREVREVRRGGESDIVTSDIVTRNVETPFMASLESFNGISHSRHLPSITNF